LKGEILGDFGHRMERTGFAGEKRRGGSGSDKRSHVSTLQVGQEFDVKIEKLGHKGDGMVSIEGMTVFVKNVDEGEEVKIKIKKVMDTIAFADRLT
jgi:predicted RNA-binding protein with TRAM domain